MSENEAGASPMSLSTQQLARALNGVGEKPVTTDMIQADIAAGAPTNADGTLNVVQYAAWLVREMRS